ncbi:MBL fold metallo-hydrolase [Cytobacillus horneckiae]|uniref:MBL fold metallo-hydrolase n=1 Tax=Cytobacillus horneckiae TaxID=549687 RepID=A0A2N0ZAD5_9BACI|nr:MBL fold metallo-hydrolase [Cytobacillus horneckiae]MCM3179525.1 MBL fold metallo-hydrolase [Cytobacillus horneckiae]MEC1154949.1 MBL fold metallo-hydrolase [Cytobacillus horneckiae]MED2936145.1 MBL fold metallo-hydrolase [Cytobacillus horneckiae]PKG26471.1 MBL fold metallo-hydrolase [Cytobacillus horneckiae]
METLQMADLKLTWLRGGVTHLDGGAMFGVVPKPLWSRKYPSNDNNQIELRTDPILIQWGNKNILIESGLGNGKLSEKQKRNYGATEESNVDADLETLGLSAADIDYILMTHLHFDHACGLTKHEKGVYISAFPNAKIIASQVEWDEMRNPNIRSKNTYWQENWEAIQDQVVTFEGEWTLGPIRMVHTGGHSDGHSILVLEAEDQMFIHMADIMPTHAHQNVLWVLAFDDYPMDSIAAKQKWMKIGLENNAWFFFYHDTIYRAVKWDQEGKSIIDSLEREN